MAVSPNVAYLQVQESQIAGINALLKKAADNIDKQLAGVTGDGPGAVMTRIQLQAQAAAIKSEIATVMSGSRDLIGQGQRDAAAAASKVISDFEAGPLSEILTPAELASLSNAEANRAASGVIALLGRSQSDPIPLSKQVYLTTAWTNNQLDNLVNDALLRGLSASQFAAEVRKFIDPSTPGGASYAAKRLARTEINNAYHAASVGRYQDSGLVEFVDWNLSKSHIHVDICDILAAESPYPVDKVPNKPHPQDLCFVTADMPSPEDFLAKLFNGDYFDPTQQMDGTIDSSGWTQDLKRALGIGEFVAPIAVQVFTENDIGALTSLFARREALAEAFGGVAEDEAGFAELEAGAGDVFVSEQDIYAEYWDQLELDAPKSMLELPALPSVYPAPDGGTALSLAEDVLGLPAIDEVYALTGGSADIGAEMEQIFSNRLYDKFGMKIFYASKGDDNISVSMFLTNSEGESVGKISGIWSRDPQGHWFSTFQPINKSPGFEGLDLSGAQKDFDDYLGAYNSNGNVEYKSIDSILGDSESPYSAYNLAQQGMNWSGAEYGSPFSKPVSILNHLKEIIQKGDLADKDFKKLSNWYFEINTTTYDKWPSPYDIANYIGEDGRPLGQEILDQSITSFEEAIPQTETAAQQAAERAARLKEISTPKLDAIPWGTPNDIEPFVLQPSGIDPVRTALYAYTNGSYEAMNAFLREGLSADTMSDPALAEFRIKYALEDDKEFDLLVDEIKTLQKSLLDSPATDHAFTLYRSTGFKSLGLNDLNDLQSMVGKETDNASFLSAAYSTGDDTSSGYGQSFPFGNFTSKVNLRIDIPKGSHVSRVPQGGGAYGSAENEAIIPPGSKFRWLSVTKVGQKWWADVLLIQD